MTPELATRIKATSRGVAARPLGAGTLAPWFAFAWIGLMWSAAITLAWRRLAGALEISLSWQGMVAAGILLTAAATAARAACRVSSQAASAASSRFAEAMAPGLITAGLLAVAAALSVPGTTWTALVVLWGIVAAEELWAWGAKTLGRRPDGVRARRGKTAAAKDRACPAAAGAGSWSPLGAMATGSVVQQQIRSRRADGTEELRGWLRIALAPGQRSASAHVAFCPPFARTPRVVVDQREGPQARVKSVQLLPHGTRFDLKLSQPSESAGYILLEFSAEEAAGGEGGC